MEIWKPEEVKWNVTDEPCGFIAISDPLVMRSAAGWYVGEVCKEQAEDMQYIAPYCRMTDYYETPEQAHAVLQEMMQ